MLIIHLSYNNRGKKGTNSTAFADGIVGANMDGDSMVVHFMLVLVDSAVGDL